MYTKTSRKSKMAIFMKIIVSNHFTYYFLFTHKLELFIRHLRKLTYKLLKIITNRGYLNNVEIDRKLVFLYFIRSYSKIISKKL